MVWNEYGTGWYRRALSLHPADGCICFLKHYDERARHVLAPGLLVQMNKTAVLQRSMLFYFSFILITDENPFNAEL